MIRTIISLLLLSIFLLEAKGQSTAAQILSDVLNVQSDLKRLELSLGSPIASSIQAVSTKLDGYQQHLKLTDAEKKAPLADLDTDLRNQWQLLQNTVQGLHQLTQWKEECIYRNAGVFTAALQTAGLQLGSNARSFGKSNDVLVTSVSFDKQPGYMVPSKGGTLIIKGTHLSKKHLPLVKIYNEQIRVVLLDHVKVEKGASEQEASISLDEAFIINNSGNIIYVEITPRKDKRLGKGTKELSPVYIPLKIPEARKYTYVLRAYIQNKWTDKEVFELKKEFWEGEVQNDQCGQTHNVQDSHTWSICDDCNISNVKGVDSTKSRHMDRGGQFAFSIPAKDKIDYAVTIGKPVCKKKGKVNKLQTFAYWQFSVWPEITKTIAREENTNNVSDIFDLSDMVRNVELSIPVSFHQGTTTSFWYELVVINNRKPEILYTSQPLTPGGDGQANDTYITKHGYKFAVSLNNKPVNNNVKVSFTITPASCPSYY